MGVLWSLPVGSSGRGLERRELHKFLSDERGAGRVSPTSEVLETQECVAGQPAHDPAESGSGERE